MSPICHIHVGMHKTGTTTIQNTLFRNRKAVARFGVNYWDIGSNHSVPLVSLFTGDPTGYRERRRLDRRARGTIEEDNDATTAKLRRAVAENRSEHFVISGEGLSSTSFPESCVTRFAAAIRPDFERVQVIVYVRHPFSYASSASQQLIRHGKTIERMRRRPPRAAYRLRIEKYVNVFGKDNVDIRLYDEAAFLNNDLVTDFLSTIVGEGQARAIGSRLKAVRRNVSLSNEAVHIIDAINRMPPSRDAGRQDAERARSAADYLQRLSGEPFRLDRGSLERYAGEIADDVAWLSELTGGRIAFSLDEEACARYGAGAEPGFDADTMGRLVNAIALDVEHGRLLTAAFRIVKGLA